MSPRFFTRTIRPLLLLALLLPAVPPAGGAPAESIPAPTEPLRDYDGRGIIQIEFPARERPVRDENGQKIVDPGLTTWFLFRQAYVRPDRILLQLGFGGQRIDQVILVDGNIERRWAPGTPFVVERIFRNLETAAENPMLGVQLCMATYARVFREMEGGRLLPPEDLDRLKPALQKRIEELDVLRRELAASKDPTQLPRSTAAAAEQARLRDDLDQIELRRAHPCWIVEFPNKELIPKLYSQGLTGANVDLLARGTTRVWLTKAEGLPIKIETTDSDGRVSIFILFKELKINTGLHPGDLALGAPPGTRLISATADLRDARWEDKMNAQLSEQIERLHQELSPLRRPRQPATPQRPQGSGARPR